MLLPVKFTLNIGAFILSRGSCKYLINIDYLVLLTLRLLLQVLIVEYFSFLANQS